MFKSVVQVPPQDKGTGFKALRLDKFEGNYFKGSDDDDLSNDPNKFDNSDRKTEGKKTKQNKKTKTNSLDFRKCPRYTD